MKRINFEFEGNTYTVDVERHGDEIIVHKGDETFSVILLPDASAVTPSKAPETAPPRPVDQPTPLPVSVPVSAQSPPSDDAITAPMAGIVKEIKVTVGYTVEEGQVVLIMEAMKMDIDVQAKASGIVAEVSVKQGDTVSVNQQLMVIHQENP